MRKFLKIFFGILFIVYILSCTAIVTAIGIQCAFNAEAKCELTFNSEE
jgi:hypothetical protein